jgi:mono/diheme cytochrome c family protein
MRRMVTSLLLLCAAGCATSGQTPKAPKPLDVSADRGRFYALRSCAGCHAVAGQGESPNGSAPSFAAIRLRYNALSLPRRLAEISKNGHHEMPPIYMTPDEIQDIVAYVETVEGSSGAVRLPEGQQAGVSRGQGA